MVFLDLRASLRWCSCQAWPRAVAAWTANSSAICSASGSIGLGGVQVQTGASASIGVEADRELCPQALGTAIGMKRGLRCSCRACSTTTTGWLSTVSDARSLTHPVLELVELPGELVGADHRLDVSAPVGMETPTLSKPAIDRQASRTIASSISSRLWVLLIASAAAVRACASYLVMLSIEGSERRSAGEAHGTTATSGRGGGPVTRIHVERAPDAVGLDAGGPEQAGPPGEQHTEPPPYAPGLPGNGAYEATDGSRGGEGAA